eukprot:5548394-Heterocapsa_arctica.AAC.1
MKGYAVKVTKATPPELLSALRYRERWRFDESEVEPPPGPCSHVKGWEPLVCFAPNLAKWFETVKKRVPVGHDRPRPRWKQSTVLVPRVGAVPVLGPEWANDGRWAL